MFKKIEVIGQEGETQEITINTDNVCFVSKVNLPTNIKGLDGQPKTKEGTAIALTNGIIVNSESSVDKIVHEVLGVEKKFYPLE